MFLFRYLAMTLSSFYDSMEQILLHIKYFGLIKHARCGFLDLYNLSDCGP